VIVDADRLLRAGEAMARAGAAWLDVGAMSTAPYLEARIPEALEADRLHWAVGLLTTKLDLPVSADVSRVGPARAALDAGARMINDVTGLAADPALARLTADAGAALVLMAAPATAPSAGEPVATVRAALARSLAIARAAGIPDERILVDPGIGFFRGDGVTWPEWDCRVLAGLPALRALGRPLYVGVSRKSFIGAVAGVADPCRARWRPPRRRCWGARTSSVPTTWPRRSRRCAWPRPSAAPPRVGSPPCGPRSRPSGFATRSTSWWWPSCSTASS
jgi:dihydropteroate synthase